MGAAIINIVFGLVSIVGVATGNVVVVCSGPDFVIVGSVSLALGAYQLWQLRRRQAAPNPHVAIGGPLISIPFGVVAFFGAAAEEIACNGRVFAVGGAVLTGLGLWQLWRLRRLRRQAR